MRRDGKDAGLEKILAGIFQQSRIALPADDLVVDASRLFACPDFAHEPSIAVPDRKLSYRSRLGNRKQVSAFESRVGVVAKYLFDVGGRDL